MEFYGKGFYLKKNLNCLEDCSITTEIVLPEHFIKYKNNQFIQFSPSDLSGIDSDLQNICELTRILIRGEIYSDDYAKDKLVIALKALINNNDLSNVY